MVGRAYERRPIVQPRVLVTDEVKEQEQEQKPKIPLWTKLRFVPRKMVTAETPSRVEMNALAGALDRVSAASAVVYSFSR
jgi:hypothetical protein